MTDPRRPGPVTGRIPPRGWEPGQPYSVAGQPWPEVWLSRRYQVAVCVTDGPTPGHWLWLSIKRHSKEPMGWRELQIVKNAIAGPEREAIELFPAESRLVDTSNQYHLFVLPEGMRMPLGWNERAVVDGTGETAPGKARQEPIRHGRRHGEVMTEEEANRRAAAYVAAKDRG